MSSLLLVGLLGTVLAEPPALAASTYTVQPGDTFSSIAASHYGNSGVWRALWKANPQVSSPAALSVGQDLNLPDAGSLDIPRTYRGSDGLQVVKLSPEVIGVPLDQQQLTIPSDAIEPFVRRPRIFNVSTASRSPYVIGQGQGRLTGADGDKVYVRGLPHDRIVRFGIYREGGPYYDIQPSVLDVWGGTVSGDGEYSTRWGPGLVNDEVREDVLGYEGFREGLAYLPKFTGDEAVSHTLTGGLLGYEAVLVAVADLIKYEPEGFSTLRVTDAFLEVRNGDVVLPLEEGEIGLDFVPEALDHKVWGRVIKVPLSYTQAGQFDLVYLNVGSVHGVTTGAVFDVSQVPNQSYDPRQNRNVILPRERVGQVMVVRTFERISFAIVLETKSPLQVADVVESVDSL